MNVLERGMLLLCCALPGSEVKPLTSAEFMRLERALFEKSGVGEVTVAALSAEGIERSEAERICALLDRETLLDAYLARARQLGIGVLTRLNPAYPQVLLQKLRRSAPPVLFYKGKTELLQNRCVSLVGSRRLAPMGEAFARRVGALAATEGLTLVSGGAAGADLAAQQACRALEGSVIVFAADRLMEHAEQKQVIFCSEEGFDVPFSTPRAHSRNRLIHAMGERTFVAQCTHGHGGTWAGTVENLKKGLSPVYCHADGSAAAQALCELGAEALSYDDLTSVLFPERARSIQELELQFEEQRNIM